jgi:hypothetical protein
MGKGARVINHRAQVAEIYPTAAYGAAQVIIRRVTRGFATSLVEIPAPEIRPHRKASFTRIIAGCSGFFIFTQCGERPAR